MLKEKLVQTYGESNKEIRVFHSPGRVNIIGEHTDYNGGYVFPCALNFGTFAAFRLRDDNKICFATTNFDLKVEVDLSDLKYEEVDDWANYPKGVVHYIKELGHKLQGFEVLFEGNIPNGAGLSSSASIELAMAVALNDVFNLNIDMLELVKLSQKSENLFNGVNCGIMDQFAVGMGKENYAMFLNCETLEYSHIPLKLNGYKLVISNTNKRRGLADSKYNERRSQCETAVKDLNKKLSIKNLSDLSLSEFNENIELIESEVVRRRAKHVISENHRVLQSVEALKNNDLEMLGKLMIESHNSLRDDYEVTGIELDTLVSEALKLPYVIGSRMTGAGFGGCTISIVKEDMVDEFIKVVTKNYEKIVGYKPTMYIGETGDGAKEV